MTGKKPCWTFGAASADITPSTPQFMVGYYRTKPSAGVYHPLYAKALYMTDGAAEAVLMAVDVCVFTDETTAMFRKAISAATGVPPGHIVMSATHTHTAPMFSDRDIVDGTGPADAAHVAFVREAMADAAQAAKRNAKPGRAEFSRIRSRVGVNRRRWNNGEMQFLPNPEGAHDRAVDTRWVVGRDGKPIASVTSYGCHATALGGQLIGGDYPGYFGDLMQRKAGGVALWCAGCAGNVRPWFSGTLTEFGGGTPAHAKLMGYQHARETLAGRKLAFPVELGRLGISRCVVDLPTRKPWNDREIRKIMGPENIRVYGKNLRVIMAEIHRNKRSRCEVQVLSLNPAHHLVFWGGEICTDVGIGLRDLCPGQIVTPHGCANNMVGYVAAEHMFPQGGYEVILSRLSFCFRAPFVPNVQEYLWRATMKLMAANGR